MQATSIAYWVWMIRQYRSGQMPMAQYERPPGNWTPHLVLTVLIVWILVIPLVRFSLDPTIRTAPVPNDNQDTVATDNVDDLKTNSPDAAPERKTSSLLLTVQLACLANAIILAIVIPWLMAQPNWHRSDFGWRWHDWPRQLSNGFDGFIAAAAPVYLVLLATSSWRNPESQHQFLQFLASKPPAMTIVWIGFAVVVMAPLTEEFIFRVVLQGWLQSKIGATRAIVIVAVAFSGVHGWPDALPLIPLALSLGYVYYRRNSFLAVVFMHALFNAMNLGMALLQQYIPTTATH